ncbi:MAG TPA: response regulator transcription factor [Acidimicrobiales bacterium]|nr:response regulator transcription factor [Acidimicrobiales bacterium]
MSPRPPIRVMIVDDHAVVRDGIRSLLAGFDEISIVATAAGAAEALDRCAQMAVDVVLMDLSMPGMDGVTATARLLELHPTLRVVVLTGFVEDGPIRAAVQAGASACLLKTVSADELVEAIRGVVNGRSTFSSEFLPALIRQTQRTSSSAGLTPRERDILTLLAGGQANKDIARALGLSDGTVRMYVSTILAKLGAANRTEATVLAIRQGLVEQQR